MGFAWTAFQCAVTLNINHSKLQPRNSLCMVPSALSDLTVRASGRVAKNSARGRPPKAGRVHYF